MALPGVRPEQVDMYIGQRQALLEQGLAAPPFPFGQGFAANAANTFSIQVEAILGDNARFSRQVVARLGGSFNEPATILAWRSLLPGSGRDVATRRQ
jgi:hypothetical protein